MISFIRNRLKKIDYIVRTIAPVAYYRDEGDVLLVNFRDIVPTSLQPLKLDRKLCTLDPLVLFIPGNRIDIVYNTATSQILRINNQNQHIINWDDINRKET